MKLASLIILALISCLLSSCGTMPPPRRPMPRGMMGGGHAGGYSGGYSSHGGQVVGTHTRVRVDRRTGEEEILFTKPIYGEHRHSVGRSSYSPSRNYRPSYGGSRGYAPYRSGHSRPSSSYRGGNPRNNCPPGMGSGYGNYGYPGGYSNYGRQGGYGRYPGGAYQPNEYRYPTHY